MFCYENRIELRTFWVLVEGMGQFGLLISDAEES